MADDKLVSMNAFAATVTLECKLHADQAMADTREAVSKTAKEAAASLRKHKTFSGRKTTGGYAAGWRAKTKVSGLSVTSVVYNRKKPWLAHLLELGHGGPVPAKAYPHIAPVYESAAAALLARLR